MYTTIGEIRNYVIARHEQTGNRIGFPQALQELVDSGSPAVSPVMPTPGAYSGPEETFSFRKPADTNADQTLQEHPSEPFLIQKQFEHFLWQIPVDIDRVLRNKDPMVIEENATIPLGQNLLSYVHLPFIDDRIHTHNHFEINYVYSGSARQIIDSEQRQLLAGEFCIFAPNMRHNVLVDDTDSLVISIPVRKSTFDSIFGRLMTQNDLLSLFFKNTLYQEHQSNYLLFKTDPADQEITALIRHITIESNSSRKYAAAYVDCLVPQLFYTLLRKYSDTVLYYGSGSKDPTQSDFALMLTYVQNHYTDISLTDLARLFGYSPEYVSRLFSRNMHQSFNQIVQNLRMQKAAELLRTTDLSISAVTEQCGYTSPDYFTRNFRRHFHCSPTEYRKQS